MYKSRAVSFISTQPRLFQLCPYFVMTLSRCFKSFTFGRVDARVALRSLNHDFACAAIGIAHDVQTTLHPRQPPSVQVVGTPVTVQ